MIPFEEAVDMVLRRTPVLEPEVVGLADSAGRVLADALAAGIDWPRFDNSAVDGFGVRVADVRGASPQRPAQLRCVGTIAAGENPAAGALAPGAAVRIMTGAPVPPGVEAVVMREDVADHGAHVAVHRSVEAGAYIRRRGEECCAGEQLLAAGTPVTPQVLGLIAALGVQRLAVHRRPAVAVISTGDELVAPGAALLPGQIYDSNGLAVAAAVRVAGAGAVEVSHAKDDPAGLRAVLEAALRSVDVVVTIGGVSVGDFDHVRGAFGALGVEQVFWRVAMKPGKPNFFGVCSAAGCGRSGARVVFGLPGNPVSALVSCHHFVAPALRRMQGLASVRAPRHEARLRDTFRRRPGRLEFARGVAVRLDGGLVVTPVAGQGSHMIAGLARANCMIVIPQELEVLEAGDQVMIEWL